MIVIVNGKPIGHLQAESLLFILANGGLSPGSRKQKRGLEGMANKHGWVERNESGHYVLTDTGHEIATQLKEML